MLPWQPLTFMKTIQQEMINSLSKIEHIYKTFPLKENAFGNIIWKTFTTLYYL